MVLSPFPPLKNIIQTLLLSDFLKKRMAKFWQFFALWTKLTLGRQCLYSKQRAQEIIFYIPDLVPDFDNSIQYVNCWYFIQVGSLLGLVFTLVFVKSMIKKEMMIQKCPLPCLVIGGFWITMELSNFKYDKISPPPLSIWKLLGWW